MTRPARTKQPKEPKQAEFDSSTLSALLQDRPKRGRPKHQVRRQSVYISLSAEDKELIARLGDELAEGLGRADVADLAVTILNAKMESLRRAVAGRNREIPEGVTDLEALYLLWDLSPPPPVTAARWTSVRVSPQQVIELGRVQGTLNAAFGASRSEAFGLALALLVQFLNVKPLVGQAMTLSQVREAIQQSVN
jgi:hypothetical protein